MVGCMGRPVHRAQVCDDSRLAFRWQSLHACAAGNRRTNGGGSPRRAIAAGNPDIEPRYGNGSWQYGLAARAVREGADCGVSLPWYQRCPPRDSSFVALIYPYPNSI